MLLKGRNKKGKSGILLALSSLPSNYGIGSLGIEAFKFIDFLKKSHQSYWQLLPLCPVGKGNSPYSSPSTFAGEILYIDLDLLIEEGLLTPEDIKETAFPKNTDYKMVREFKLPLLKKAADNFNTDNKNFLEFKKDNAYWLEDYCLFMAIKQVENGLSFDAWKDSLKYKLPNAINEFKLNHKKEIDFFHITQYFFYCQFLNLKAYADKNGISLIGDIPFYVCFDSADVWSNPECFKLGRDMTPVLVAGVPPDVFSSDGQLWGNPIYDWNYQRKNDYLWWRQRLFHYSRLFDVIRIDHFRAFADFYTIAYGSENARMGVWEKGEGMHFWNTVTPYLEHSNIIAEDLGGETPEVQKLVIDSGFPNMKILQFAFDSDLKDPFLPKNFSKNCVCYTGTHDNDTTFGWYETISKKEKVIFEKTVPKENNLSPTLRLILFGMKSKAQTVIIPMQDYLELPSSCRMNTPGKAYGNWIWRFEKNDLTEELVNLVKKLSSGRN